MGTLEFKIVTHNLQHCAVEVDALVRALYPGGHFLHVVASQSGQIYFLAQSLQRVFVVSFLSTRGSGIVPGGQTKNKQ